MSDPTKTKMSLVDFGFVEAMAKALQDGLCPGRERDGWMEMVLEKPEAFEDALLRHYGKYECGGKSKAKQRQLAKIAVNAMILWWGEQEKND